ncbi:MAG: endolytic transglycosylase MltG [Prevotella sp.]|nr:endolytic transglycosylase MltG [Prevotella sp.]
MDKKKKSLKKIIVAADAAVTLLLIAGYYIFFSSMNKADERQYVYIDDDDNIDSVIVKMDALCTPQSMLGFKLLASVTSYADHVRSGRYDVGDGKGAFNVFRRIKNGMQAPVNLTIPNVRTVERLAGALSKKLMMDSVTVLKALTDSAVCAKYHYTPQTIVCMFIPNTYDVYWNISTDKLLDRMDKESKRFWNDERTQKANDMKLTKEQVITLASIVDEETANDQEKPMVAGMYYNRLMADMPLQADPTIKFALNDFSIRRIYHNMLQVNSPYNTYKNTGLPPGPIRIPTVVGIDAVLNYTHHKYLYMCAKEDFSGTHNFAETYQEHLQNAAKYSDALNKRGIK